jgi:hypothetical protein
MRPSDRWLSHVSPVDRVVDRLAIYTWHYDSRGIFCVKSAYKLAVQIRDREGCIIFGF